MENVNESVFSLPWRARRDIVFSVPLKIGEPLSWVSFVVAHHPLLSLSLGTISFNSTQSSIFHLNANRSQHSQGEGSAQTAQTWCFFSTSWIVGKRFSQLFTQFWWKTYWREEEHEFYRLQKVKGQRCRSQIRKSEFYFFLVDAILGKWMHFEVRQTKKRKEKEMKRKKKKRKE